MRWLVCCLLVACAHANAPSAFDREQAARPVSAARYGAPRDAKPMALAPGQWVEQRVIDQDGHHSVVTTKVIGLFGHQVWLERETQNEAGTTVRKLLVGMGNRKDADTIDVYQYWIKQGDRVEQVMMLGAEKPRLQAELATLLVLHTSTAQEDVAVTAGTFERSFTARVKERVLGREIQTDAWWHSGVPFNGSLRTRRHGAPGGTELVSFGLTGAKSAF